MDAEEGAFEQYLLELRYRPADHDLFDNAIRNRIKIAVGTPGLQEHDICNSHDIQGSCGAQLECLGNDCLLLRRFPGSGLGYTLTAELIDQLFNSAPDFCNADRF